MLFHFISFHFILFYFILFYFILFYFILFYSCILWLRTENQTLVFSSNIKTILSFPTFVAYKGKLRHREQKYPPCLLRAIQAENSVLVHFPDTPEAVDFDLDSADNIGTLEVFDVLSSLTTMSHSAGTFPALKGRRLWPTECLWCCGPWWLFCGPFSFTTKQLDYWTLAKNVFLSCIWNSSRKSLYSWTYSGIRVEKTHLMGP